MISLLAIQHSCCSRHDTARKAHYHPRHRRADVQFHDPEPAQAWFDRIIITGKTFSYSEAGAKGLAGGKKVIVASCGGLYAPGTPQEANDFQEPYLRAILGFIGIKDIEIVRAEGVAYGPEQHHPLHREQAVRATWPAKPSGSGRMGETECSGSFIVRNARKVTTKCLRSRLTRAGDIGTTALSFLGTITGKLSSSAAALKLSRRMRGSL
jgi:hypothetical protein